MRVQEAIEGLALEESGAVRARSLACVCCLGHLACVPDACWPALGITLCSLAATHPLPTHPHHCPHAALEEASSLVNEGDLLVTALSLGFATTALREQPGCAPTVVDKVLPQALALVKSPLLQGALRGMWLAAADAASSSRRPEQLVLRLRCIV